MGDRYQKIPDGNGGFIFVESDSGNYSKEDIEKKENENKKIKESVERKKNYSEKKTNIFIWSWVFLIITGCYLAFDYAQNYPYSPSVDPSKVLSPSERKAICYELYDTDEERASLLACIARVNNDS